MRSAPWIGLGILLLAGRPLGAQSTLYTATVSAPEAEVRAGPSSNAAMYVTNRLRKGDRVEVIKEMEDGWIGIRPPAGSFSWISSDFVHQATPGRPTWIVVCSENAMVPLLIGSSVMVEKPTVQGVKVRRGAQLRAVGSVKRSDDGNWLPVEAPPGEVRYIRASDVAKAGENSTATTPPLVAPPTTPSPGPGTRGVGGNPPGLPTSPPGAAAVAPAVTATTDARWLRAMDLEKAGRFDEAIRAYLDLGTQVRNSDQDLALKAFTRAEWLDKMRRQNAPPPPAPNTDARYLNQPAPTPGVPAGMVTSNPGTLQRAGSTIDNRPTYLLLNSQGIPMLYAQPYPGISLEPYADRAVQLIGTLQQRTDVRAWVMTVSQVRVLQ